MYLYVYVYWWQTLQVLTIQCSRLNFSRKELGLVDNNSQHQARCWKSWSPERWLVFQHYEGTQALSQHLEQFSYECTFTAITDKFHQVWMAKLPEIIDFCLHTFRNQNKNYLLSANSFIAINIIIDNGAFIYNSKSTDLITTRPHYQFQINLTLK